MAELFATQFPKNIDSTLIYDTEKKYYRPFTDTDFAGGAAGVDAFGRQRVSEPEMIFNSKQIFNNDPLYFDDIQESGSGTSSVYSKDRASTTLSVSANTAGKRTRQTFMRINYQAGKAQLIFLTGVLSKSGGGAGITSRMGYFDDDNGIFLRKSGNIIGVVLRSSVSGSPVDTVVTQANWNIDKMQGNGPSGVNLDFTKTQILVIDFEWLGVGRVRIGFNVDGKTFYCHEFLNANNKDSVYMSTPNLPIRYQIENDGNGVASSIECICCSVISEGGRENVATNGYVSTGGISITATNNFTNAILGIRLKDDFIAVTVDILDVSLLTASNDNYEWQLIFNPSGVNNLSYSGVQNSSIEFAIAPNQTHISGGYVIAGGYAQAKTDIQAESLKSLLKLGSSITGKKDQIILACYPLGNSNSVIYGGVNYREFI